MYIQYALKKYYFSRQSTKCTHNIFRTSFTLHGMSIIKVKKKEKNRATEQRKKTSAKRWFYLIFCVILSDFNSLSSESLRNYYLKNNTKIVQLHRSFFKKEYT